MRILLVEEIRAVGARAAGFRVEVVFQDDHHVSALSGDGLARGLQCFPFDPSGPAHVVSSKFPVEY